MRVFPGTVSKRPGAKDTVRSPALASCMPCTVMRTMSAPASAHFITCWFAPWFRGHEMRSEQDTTARGGERMEGRGGGGGRWGGREYGCTQGGDSRRRA